MTARRLVIVRHGRTAYNAGGRFQGQLDTPLDDVGRAQATTAATVLGGYLPGLVISSDSSRAAGTAAPLAATAGLDVRLDSRLREVDMGRWTGLTREEAEDRFPGEYADWVAGVDTARGGGETFKEVADRAGAAVDEHLRAVPTGESLIVFTHGGTARALTGWLLDLPWDWWWRFRALDNTGRTVLVETARGWRLNEFNVSSGP